MDEMELMLYLSPVILIQVGLMIAGLLDLNKQEQINNKTMWLLIIILINLIGSVIYFWKAPRERKGAVNTKNVEAW